jgi:mono/diheme cytochrome c family protein
MRTTVLALVAIAVSGIAACSRAPATAPEGTIAPATAASAAAPITPGDPMEGKRIAHRVGCAGCHMPDGRGGGMDVALPTGDRIVAPNLTERRSLYDNAGLVALLRLGITHDGHRPFGMPIFMFQHLSDGEVRDIIAWLRTLPAVNHPQLAESSLTAETLRQIETGEYPYDDDKPDPGNVAPAARPTDALALGRYLAFTSCGECHGRDLAGWGPDDPTPSLVVVNKAYTAETFARLLRTGIAANGKETATGRMSDTARWRFATLTRDEIAALKLYLDSR